MDKSSLNSKPQTQHASVSEYSDFARLELAIALNSRKRGDVVIALVQENEKDNPDIEKISRLNQEAEDLILEKQEIYNGNKEIQNKVIETFKYYILPKEKENEPSCYCPYRTEFACFHTGRKRSSFRKTY